MRRAGRIARFSLVFGLSVGFGGCRSVAPPPFRTFVGPEPTYDSGEDRSNAFSGYVRAALDVEKQAGPLADRVVFDLKQKAKVQQVCADAVKLVGANSLKICRFEFRMTKPFDAPPYQRGWRLISRCMVWDIESAIKKKNYAGVLATAQAGFKFGFDLMGGGATDASLGLVIIDDIRRTIGPHLNEFGASQLNSLAKSVRFAMKNRPPAKRTFENEQKNMLLAVQEVQEAYRSDKLDEFGKNLGQSADDAIKYLKELKRKDASERPAYFDNFAAEAGAEVELLIKRAETPAVMRGEWPKNDAVRPWKRLSRHFFQTGRPLIDWYDMTLARTRLMVLNAYIIAYLKSIKSAPSELKEFPPELKVDPYSGKELIYRVNGLDYKLYSVGANLRDDGGATDANSETPDLMLEGSR